VDQGAEGCLLTGVRWDMEWLASRERFQGNSKANLDALGAQIYPNPLSSYSDLLNISIPGSVLATVDVFNLAGQKVFSENIKDGTGLINLGHLTSKGVYILKIIDEKKSFIKKIVIK
ncbi:T9SS type A sorting domain-containing protein, partial [Aquimarina pacifica]|uniref:T9SS type A sorting domain-containing protein n=1 Tax=Aquimarina pacifica TaxID=1296415 RepID=UPI0004726C32